MANPDPIFVKNRDGILAFRPAPELLREGEYGTLFVVDCAKHIIFNSGPQPLLRFSSPVEITVCTNCPRQVRVYLTYQHYDRSGELTSLTRRLHFQFEGRILNQKFKCISRSVVIPGDSKALRFVFQAGRKLAREKRESYSRSTRPPRTSKVRPSPEEALSSFKKHKYDHFPPGFNTSLGTASYYRYRRTWTGVRTPNFGSLKQGALPINSHSVSLRLQPNHPMMFRKVRYPTGDVDFVEVFANGLVSTVGTANYWSELPSHNSKAAARAIKKLVNRSGGEIEANLAQDLAQIDQMTRLMKNTMSRVTQSVSALRKGNILGAVQALWRGRTPRYRRGGGPRHGGSLASNWLELQYGWKPLLNDIRGSMEALARYNLADISYVVTASAIERESLQTDYLSPMYPNKGPVCSVFANTVSTCKYGIRYRFDNHLIAYLAQTGFTNLLNLAWEVLPFSFVADWALPIGPYLETLSAWDGLQFMDGYQVRFTRRTRFGYMDCQKISISGAPRLDDMNGRAYGEGIQFDRVKLTTFPDSVVPSFKNPISTIHASNALALMIAVFT